MTNKLTPSRYKEIVADVLRLFKTAQDSLVTAYWKTGQYVVEIEQNGDSRARYGDDTLSHLSKTLSLSLGKGFSVNSLQRMRQFYQENPKYSPASKLPWAHHIELMPVSDAKVRKALEQKAVREGLTRDDLRVLVRHESVRAQVEANLKERDSGLGTRKNEDRDRGTSPELRVPELLKVPKLGPLDTYAIVDPGTVSWPEENVLLFDHGFKGYRALTPAEARGLKAGDIVEWTGARLKKMPYGVRGTAKTVLYTYRAYLESVIDGDTIWVVLGTGLREVSRQKLRFRGIDCPEINTVEGQKAKKFVEDVLKDVPSLTVLSSKNPTFDRYEADVFMKDKEGKEVYFNNLLLEEGYAVRVRE